jgi:hypothetical protein
MSLHDLHYGPLCGREPVAGQEAGASSPDRTASGLLPPGPGPAVRAASGRLDDQLGCALSILTDVGREIRRARSGPGLWPGPRRQARWVGRGSRVNGAPKARPAKRDAKHR